MSTANILKAIAAPSHSIRWRRFMLKVAISLGFMLLTTGLVAGAAWIHADLPFSLRSIESDALQGDRVAKMLSGAGIVEVRRLPDARMYVVLASGVRSRGVCLSNGHTVPGPLASCESRGPQGWKSLPDDFDYRLVGGRDVQYRGDAAPQDMSKAEFVQAIAGELRTAQALAQEVTQAEREKALVTQTEAAIARRI